MDNEIEENQIDMIIKYLLSDLCHECIENICNSTLKQVQKLKIESPVERVQRYLTFLKQRIASMRIDDQNLSDSDHYCCDCANHFENATVENEKLLTMSGYEKIQNYFNDHDTRVYDQKKPKKRKKKR